MEIFMMKSMTMCYGCIYAQFIKRSSWLSAMKWLKERTEKHNTYIRRPLKCYWAANKWKHSLIWKMCSHLRMFTSETSGYKTNYEFKFILPSDRFTNNWWCQFFGLLSQIRLVINIVAIGMAMNHPNHSLCAGLVF